MQNLRNQSVVADFFAQGYRVSGTFQAGTRLFSDIIYDANTNYMTILDAYLSPITNPAKISAYYKTTTLRKSKLDFVLTLEEKDGLRRDQRYMIERHTTGRSGELRLCLTVPFFEIQGSLISTNRTFNARSFLAQEAGTFITLLDVTARCTFDPDVNYQGGAALIARDSISFLGEQQGDEA